MTNIKRGRGRPRKNPEKLAQWKPPEDWVRVVAWVSPDERKALKQMAINTDTSVAELIRSLASGFSNGVISPEEVFDQINRGKAVMEKIPTVFDRGDNFKVIDKVREECNWVIAGEGIPTEKLDGTNIRLTVRSGVIVRVEKRRNPNKSQKAQGIKDGWYVDANIESKEDKWIFEAVENTNVHDWPDDEHSCEALGPKIQGNPLGLLDHKCVPFNLTIPDYNEVTRTFEGMKEFLAEVESKYCPGHMAEGIVFHHSDGRRAKIKRKDFKY